MSDDRPIEDDQGADGRTVWPIVAAAAVVLVVLGAIFLGDLLSPAEDNVTESDRIAVAIHNFVGARNESDEDRRKATACPGFDEEKSPLHGVTGKVEVGSLDNPSIDGDRAKADVTTKVDGRENTSTWHLTRSGQDWLVCN